MSIKRKLPNLENCCLEKLSVAAKASEIQRTHMRLTAIRALSMGLTHQQVG